MEQKIKELLREFLTDDSKILELEQYGTEVLEIAYSNGMYKQLKKLFQPLELNISGNSVVKIYFDPFSSDIISRIIYDNSSQDETEKSDKQELLESIYKIDFSMIDKIKIKDTHARQISGIGHPVRSIKDIIFYSEPACIRTCIDLFNKNIRTTMNDTEGVVEDGYVENPICKVSIEYSSLDEENKMVAEKLLQEGKAERYMDGDIDTISIIVPCDREETVGQVSAKLQQLSSLFKSQDILYGRSSLEEEYAKMQGAISRYSEYAKECFPNGFSVEGLIEFGELFGYGYTYDETENVLWEYPEYYQKHQNYLATMQKEKSPKI